MKPNTAYGTRPVEIGELIQVFGSAAAAYDATRGIERVALYYLANPERAPEAPKLKGRGDSEPLAVELRARRDAELAVLRETGAEEREAALRQQARSAWEASGTIRAVMAACKVGRPRARALLKETGFMTAREEEHATG